MDIVTYALCKKQLKEALAGAGILKGDPGKSAYDIAKEQGYTGTEKEWLQSLKGIAGSTPIVGANGNWFIDGEDTGISAKATHNFDDLQNKPTINNITLSGDLSLEDLGIDIPTKNSQLENDSKFLTEDDLTNLEYAKKNDIPTNVSILTNDAGYLTLNDVKDFSTKNEVENLIPTKISQLDNDANYLTEHQQLKTINNQEITGTGNITIDTNKIDDVQVNGKSVVKNKIANILLTDLNTNIGRTFTTDITVGHLTSGTQITEDMSLADILFKMLVGDEAPKGTILITGGLDEIPSSDNAVGLLDWKIEEVKDTDQIVTYGYEKTVTTGNLITEDGQFPTLAIKKSDRNIQLKTWVSKGAEAFPYPFKTVETDNYYIYYIDVRNYDEDEGGQTYIFTFEEV